MTEDNIDSTSPLPFEEYVRQTLALLVAQQRELQQQQNGFGQEMVDGFCRSAAKLKTWICLDMKVDIYTREHSYMKDDIREVRAKMNLQ